MKRTLLLVVCGGAALSAAELVVRDLRLGIAAQAPGYDYTVNGATIGASGHDSFSSGWALDGGGRWSFTRMGSAVGLVVGADALLETLPQGGGGGLSSTWLRACAGGGWAVADGVTLVAAVGAQAGASSRSNDADLHQNASTQTGSARGYDLRLEMTWLLTRRIGVGLDIGWLKAKHTLSGDRLDTTIDRSGWSVGLQVVWRFTNAPTRLE